MKIAKPTAGEKSKVNSKQFELKLGEVATTLRTIHFNVETVDPQRVKIAKPTAGEKSKVNSKQFELKLGEVVTTLRTIHFNVETVEYKNLSFIVQKDAEMIH